MKYHVVLDMTDEEIKRLKTVAIQTGRSVKELVKNAILYYMAESHIKSMLEDKTK